ncbi:MAG: hypothetical protein ACJAUW_001821, partial [Yoonia sp.]
GRVHQDDGSIHGLSPPRVCGQVECDKCQARLEVVVVAQMWADRLGHFRPATKFADRAAHMIPCFKQLQRDVFGDVARGTGQKDGLGHCEAPANVLV